ncbi:hypothetical protein LTR85_001430 [Meristemomyces frigidus]|nr:hypothetical protein LTR85_001430 [Meristemomyces frigidus]
MSPSKSTEPDPAKLQQYLQIAKDRNTGLHQLPETSLVEAAELAAIFDINAFAVEDPVTQKGEMSGICLQATRMNHSCLPNSHHEWCEEARKRNVYALSDIGAREEITISYLVPFQSREVRTDMLHKHYGFDCSCKACDLGSDFGVSSERRRFEMQTSHERLNEASKARDLLAMASHLRELLQLMNEEELAGPWEAIT